MPSDSMFVVVKVDNHNVFRRHKIVSSVWLVNSTTTFLPLLEDPDCYDDLLKQHAVPGLGWTQHNFSEIFRYDNIPDAEYCLEALSFKFMKFPFQPVPLSWQVARFIAKKIKKKPIHSVATMKRVKRDLSVIGHVERFMILKSLSERYGTVLQMSTCLKYGMGSICIKFRHGETFSQLTVGRFELETVTSINLVHCPGKYIGDIYFICERCPNLTILELNRNVFPSKSFLYIARRLKHLSTISFACKSLTCDNTEHVQHLRSDKSVCRSTLQYITIKARFIEDSIRERMHHDFPNLIKFVGKLSLV